MKTILTAIVGSQLYGTATATSDTDRCSVVLESAQESFGLTGGFETGTRKGLEGDVVAHSLRKFCKLALNGNPTVLEVLYAYPYELQTNPEGIELTYNKDWFLSRKAGAAFLGYMTQQMLRLKGERGQKNVNRAALVDAHGFDTKYAGHILRLGYEGIEYLQDGTITLPLRPDDRARVLAVKTGEVRELDFWVEAIRLKDQLEKAYKETTLPPEPQVALVEEWMIDTYMEYWNGKS